MQTVVFHVIETLGRGGAETALVSGLPALKALGVDTEVCALHAPVDLAEELRRRGIRVSVGLGGLIQRLRATGMRKRIIHTHLFYANVWGRLLGRAFGVPVVTTLHASDYRTDGAGRFGWRLAVDRALLKVKSPTFLSVSEIVTVDYRASLGVESSLCPNPLDPFWLEPAPTREEARLRLGLGAEQVVFACGRLHPHKGFDILARAARQMPDVRVVIAGGGPHRALIEAEGPVQLVGILDKRSIRNWLSASDVVAVPSRCDSFGIFALEALSAGSPVVASDIPGLRDTLLGAASLFPAEDSSALVSAVRNLLTDADKRRRLGQMGINRARTFTAEAWANFHRDIYSRLVPRES